MKKNRWYYILTAVIMAGALACLFIQPSRAGNDPYDNSSRQAAPVTKERSIVPWVVGGVLIGGGAAAAIALSSSGGGGSSSDDSSSSAADPAATPTPTPTPGATATPTPTPTPSGGSSCEDTDALGVWKSPAEVVGETTTTKMFHLYAGFSASYETTKEYNPADGSPGHATTSAFMGGWSLSTSDCMLTLSAGGDADFDGSGQISGGSVDINGVTYTKQ